MRQTLCLALCVPFLVACPFGGGSTNCSSVLEETLKSAQGSATQTDAGILITLEWQAVTGQGELPMEYFEKAQLTTGDTEFERFTVISTTRAEAEFSPREFVPLDGRFSFGVIFPDPARSGGVSGCNTLGQRGGTEDTSILQVEVSAPGDAGVRTVSTKVEFSPGGAL